MAVFKWFTKLFCCCGKALPAHAMFFRPKIMNKSVTSLNTISLKRTFLAFFVLLSLALLFVFVYRFGEFAGFVFGKNQDIIIFTYLSIVQEIVNPELYDFLVVWLAGYVKRKLYIFWSRQNILISKSTQPSGLNVINIGVIECCSCEIIASIIMSQVSHGNTGIVCQICSRLWLKAPGLHNSSIL